MADHQPDLMLKNALVLQYQGLRDLLQEYHQHIEACIQQGGVHPFSQLPQTAAHEHVELRDSPPQLAASTLVSDVMASICAEVCDSHSAIPTTTQMARFLELVRQKVKTIEDKYQVLMIVDLTLQQHQDDTTGAQTMSLFFEKDNGFELLGEWFVRSCSYQDEQNKQLTKLILQVLLRNKPTLPFARKTIVTQLRPMLTYVRDKDNKELVRAVVQRYVEASTKKT